MRRTARFETPRRVPWSLFLTAFVAACSIFGTSLRQVEKNPTSFEEVSSPSIEILQESVAATNASTTPAVLKHTTPRKLPSCQPNGCLILFFHIPKTGGMTLRDHCWSLGLDYHMWWWKRIRLLQDMRNWTTAPIYDSKVHVREFHEYPIPSFYSLRESLQSWRQIAQQHNVTLFAFSLLRDPFDQVLSAFNYFCLFQYKCRYQNQKRKTGILQPTPEWVLNVSKPNPQCTFLRTAKTNVRGAYSGLESVPDWQCERHIWKWLKQLDWVGTLERYEETMQVLQRVTGLDLNLTALERSNQSQERVQHKPIVKRQDFNPTQRQELQSRLHGDEYLYRKVQQEFTLSMWDDF